MTTPAIAVFATTDNSDADLSLPVAEAILPTTLPVEQQDIEAVTLEGTYENGNGQYAYEQQPLINNRGGTTTSTSKQSKNQKRQQNAFRVTNETNNQYWGRFNETAAVSYATNNDDPAVAIARPTENRNVRLVFVRKVYSILSVQLLVTFAICALFALHEPTKNFVTNHQGFYWFNYIFCFGVLFPLHIYKRKYPINFVLLSLFTLSMASMVGMITTMYAEAGAGDLVLEAVAITASVFVILTIYTMQSKWDFSFLGAGLGMGLWIMILWGFFAMIFGVGVGMVYSCIGSILFSGYIIYDTYMIAERLDPEDYIVGAIELYLDLVNLFLYILQILSRER